ncbi:hypothetical protein ML8HA_00282 [Lactococcus lactis]|nr:hypothetical protein [Lactococcus lactis]
MDYFEKNRYPIIGGIVGALIAVCIFTWILENDSGFIFNWIRNLYWSIFKKIRNH